MHFEGIIKSWDDDRGCGFIEPNHGGQEIFVHITAMPARSGRPVLRQRVSFEVELDHEGKKRATNVRPAISPRSAKLRTTKPTARWGGFSLFAVPAFALVFFAAGTQWRVPQIVAGAYLVLSAVCFLLYAKDKSAATAKRRRSPESVLLFVGLLGGWPGAIMAQQFLRHTASTASFRSWFWVTVVINVLVFVALSSPRLGSWRWLV